MRREPTPAEARLWHHLRARRFDAKFRQQAVIGPFIADFACRERMLVVEIDGDTHVGDEARRTGFIEAAGWRVVRFTNAEVMGNLDGVLTVIAAHLLPLPFRGEGGVTG
jgi:very-short-patch-repair endonuclease